MDCRANRREEEKIEGSISKLHRRDANEGEERKGRKKERKNERGEDGWQ
jgi:hypothetical protein